MTFATDFLVQFKGMRGFLPFVNGLIRGSDGFPLQEPAGVAPGPRITSGNLADKHPWPLPDIKPIEDDPPVRDNCRTCGDRVVRRRKRSSRPAVPSVSLPEHGESPGLLEVTDRRVTVKQAGAMAPTVLLLSCLAIASGQEWPREQIPSPRILDEVKAHDSGLAVWWTGHNGWLIKSDRLLIGTDLATEDEARLYESPITAEELAPLLDVAFITHKHGDHFNRKTARVLSERGKCTFVMPANCVEEARRLGIPEGRIKVAAPRQPFELKGVKVSPLRAIHGNPKSAVYFDANLEDCGYLIELGGRTFLQPGDSVLLEDHLFLKHVDVLFFSPTEHNMHIDASVILINELDPEYILPQHRDTYRVTPENRYWTSGYAHEVKLRLSKPLQSRYHILKQGQKLLVERAAVPIRSIRLPPR